MTSSAPKRPPVGTPESREHWGRVAIWGDRQPPFQIVRPAEVPAPRRGFFRLLP